MRIGKRRQERTGRKVLCSQGHVVGELTADGFYIQHHGRKVVVGMPREEIIHITLVCDRCKETVDLKIAPNERKNAELSIK